MKMCHFLCHFFVDLFDLKINPYHFMIPSNQPHVTLDSYSMMITSKYFTSKDDFINMICVNSKFKETLDKFRFNPISVTSNKLFRRIDTQFLYTPKDTVLNGIKQYQVCYEVNYYVTQRYPENYIFKHVLFDTQTYQKFGESALLGSNSMRKFFTNQQNEIVIPTQITSLSSESNYFKMSPYKVILHNNIISIGPSTFSHYTRIIDITIPTMLKQLNDNLFSYCKSLKSIYVPQSVEEINRCCFQSCDSLSSIDLDCPINLIPSSCFYGCSSLKSITIPTTVTAIEQSAFSHCYQLESITIGTKISFIPSDCFYYCRRFQHIFVDGEMKNVSQNVMNIPTFITSLQKDCFCGCSTLKGVVIPSSIDTIPQNCFQDCSSLSNMTLSTTITSLKENCFKGTRKLKIVNLPTSLKNIEKNAFGSITSLTIPSSINSFCEDAFYDCSELEVLTIHDNITTIPKQCFYNCHKLTCIFSYGSVNTTPTTETNFFDIFQSVRTILIPTTLIDFGYQCFGSTYDKNYVKTSSSVSVVEKKLFKDLLSLHIPSTISFLNDNCFDKCQGLKEITFEIEPPSLIMLSECTSLTHINIQNTTKITSITPLFISRLLAKNNIECTYFSLQQHDLDMISQESPESVGIFGDVFKNRKTIKSFTMETNVKCLLQSCFHSCVCLTTINLSSSLTSIGSSCFQNCLFLNNVNIPNGIQSIPNSCFEHCSRLQHINIPTTVTSIGNFAFLHCGKLKEVNIPFVVDLGKNCFENCVALTRIVMKKILYEKSAFSANITSEKFKFID